MGTRWVTLDTFLSLPFVLRFYICIHMSGQSPPPPPRPVGTGGLQSFLFLLTSMMPL